MESTQRQSKSMRQRGSAPSEGKRRNRITPAWSGCFFIFRLFKTNQPHTADRGAEKI